MRRTQILIYMLIIAISLSSCGNIFTNVDDSFDNDQKNAEATIKKIVHAINKKDKELMKDLFSKKAMSESSEISNQIDELFNHVQGEIVEWDDGGGPEISEDYEYGLVSKEYILGVDIKTTEKNYTILVIENVIDEEDSDNVGIYSLQIIDKEDETEEFHFELDDGVGIIIF